MNKSIPIAFISLFAGIILGCEPQNSTKENSTKRSSYEIDLTIQRIETSEKMKDPKTTIVGEDLMEKFDGLKYFPIEENWRIIGLYELIDTSEVFEMTTTTERVIPMKKNGKIIFSKEGKEYELFAYLNMDHPNEGLFVPFLDQTNGDETYGGGRYLDIPSPKSDSILIDFNLAYNPYCAYNHKYSCPIPPLENTLQMKVTAGEKVAIIY